MKKQPLAAAVLSIACMAQGCDDGGPKESGGAASSSPGPSAATNTPAANAGAPGQPEPEPGPEPASTPEGPEPDPNPNPEPAAPQPEPAATPNGNAGATSPTPRGGSGGVNPGPAGGVGGSAPAGSGGAGGSSVPSVDPCAAALFCDDFEDDTSGAQPGAPWTVQVNGGDVAVSDERAFSGSQSVHVSNTAGAYKRAYFSLEGEPVFPGAGAQMYGRMMMWLEATPAGSVHWTFIQGEGRSAEGTYDIYYRYGGQHEGRLMANFETNGVATDCWDHSNTVMPTQTWACLEWRFDTANDELEFWLDGNAISDIHVIGMGEGCVAQDLGGAWPAPPAFQTLRLGWEKYQESIEQNAWIDDVAVGTERLGCPAADAR